MTMPNPESDTPKAGSDHSASYPFRAPSDPLEHSSDEPIRVLIVAPELKTRRSLAAMLRDNGCQCDPVGRMSEAVGAIAGVEYDVAFVSLQLREGSGASLLRVIQERSTITKVIMLGVQPMLDDAMTAIRLGAIDLLAMPINSTEAVASVNHAAAAARRDRDRDRRLHKLQRLCNVLHGSRSDESAQVGAMCDELETTCDELQEHVHSLKLASEFQAMIENELDIEALLRVSLEHMLRKTGPTNAAIYLPSNHIDYSLGAYVNYDCPKDTADMLLDHLADVLAPRFDDLDEVLLLDTDDELNAHLGEDASWLIDSQVIVIACRHEDECLAVVTFFRDRAKPFPVDLLPQLTAMKDIFARQLSKVIRVHHRMVVDKDWLDTEDDEWGLAA